MLPVDRIGMAVLLGCALAAPVAAQPRLPPPRVLDAPAFTIHPQGALPTLAGESVDVVVGWRPVVDAARYRVSLSSAGAPPVVVETTGLRFEKRGLPAGNYQLTVTAIDRFGAVGTPSEPLPINVIEVRAIPPGADKPVPPLRGAYAVGTRFSVPGMHCELGDAPIDDLLVGPENELRIPNPGVALLRCAGIPGYLEKQVVIAPVRVAGHSTRVTRGARSIVTVTLASVAEVGNQLEIKPIGDVTLGEAKRTEFGLEVPVTAGPRATAASLSVQSAGFELGRVPLALVDAPPPPPPPPLPPLEWQALDIGGHVGAFVPPSEGRGASTLGHPTNESDIITGGPLVGLRLGFYPIRRVGLEGEASLIAGGYSDEANISQLLAARGQLAVRVLEQGRLGLRLFAGSGTLTTLKTRGTSQVATDTEIHGGAAFTVETSPNLWLRFQFSDVVTTARDDGYAHCVELQLSVMTRLGRRDSW